jgi:MFS family permease
MSPALLLLTIVSTVVIVVANNSMGALAQPDIQRQFGVGPADVGWVVFGFSASFAVATAAWGALGRRFGIGRGFAAGVLLLAAASAAAALAPSLEALIAARVIQGMGAGAIPTLGTSLVGTAFEGSRRPAALGTIVAGVGAGQAIGPILGGALIDLAGWRAVMGFSVVALPAVLAIVAARMPGGDRGARVDLPGGLLVGLAAAAAVLTLNRLPVLGLAPLTIGALVVLLGALPLIGWHSIARGGRFVPREVLLHPVYRRLVVLGAVGMASFLGSIVIVPTGVAAAQGVTGLALGVLMVPMALATSVVSPNAGRIARRFGRIATTRFSLLMLAIGPLLLALLGADAAQPALAAAMVPLGIGFGLLNAPLLDELLHTFAGDVAPVAVGTYNLLFFFGGSLGASLATALLQQGVAVPGLSDAVGAGFPTVALVLAIVPAATVALALLVPLGRRSRPLTAGDGG